MLNKNVFFFNCRESQSKWFAKRGLSWHIGVVSLKTDEYRNLTIVHIFDSTSQDATLSACILEDTLKYIKDESDEVKKVYVRSDNAGCFHSSYSIATVPIINEKSSIKIGRVDFSDPQGGKSICDRKAAHIKGHIRRYVNEGKNVVTANDFKEAVKSMPNVKGIVCSPPSKTAFKSAKIEAINSLNNFCFDENNITVWKQFEVGTGRTYTFTELGIDTQKRLPAMKVLAESTLTKRSKAETVQTSETDMEDVSEVYEESVPSSTRQTIGNRATDAISEVSDESVPSSTKQTIGYRATDAISEVSDESVPSSTRQTIGNRATDAISEVSDESVPSSTRQTIGNRATDAISEVSDESVPSSTRQTIGYRATDAISEVSDESVPSSTRQTIGNRATDAISEVSDESVPSSTRQTIGNRATDAISEVSDESVPSSTRQTIGYRATDAISEVSDESVPSSTRQTIGYRATSCKQSEDDSCSLFSCAEDGCIATFVHHGNLIRHLDIGKHKYSEDTVCLKDRTRIFYTELVDTKSHQRDSMPHVEGSSPSLLQKGWGLKGKREAKRFTADQKSYLAEKFNQGERTGHKCDPEEVSKEMRVVRDKSGRRRFKLSEFLAPNQIASYFSRIALKKRQDINTEFQEEDLRAEEATNDIHAMCTNVIENEIC